MAKTYHFDACAICGVKARFIFSPNCPHLPPQFEIGADDKPQAVIPGAEQVSDAAIAQRRANAPLKPKAIQRPCDAGLFSDEADQLDLCEMFQDPAED